MRAVLQCVPTQDEANLLQSYVRAGGKLEGLSDAELFCLDLMKVSWRVHSVVMSDLVCCDHDRYLESVCMNVISTIKANMPLTYRNTKFLAWRSMLRLRSSVNRFHDIACHVILFGCFVLRSSECHADYHTLLL